TQEMPPLEKFLEPVASCHSRHSTTAHGPCGLRFRQNQQGGMRIIGGQPAAVGAWPWMVSLQVLTYHDNRRYHVCGGTLLNAHWLLTAAHCFRSKTKVTDWRLIFGAREVVWGSNKPVKPPLQERYAEKIIIHEKYSSGSEANDIALMKITPPVPCGHFIGPGCLPQFRAGPPRIPQTCWVAGWGFLKDNAVGAPQLYHNRLCLWQQGTIRLQKCLPESMTLLGRESGSGRERLLCPSGQGDSGGPLMCRESVENSYVVVGITSWGVGCARAKRPGVYTSTWSYLNWIASKIGSNALHRIQLPTPPPPSTPAPPTKPASTQPSIRPPWYFQHPPRPPPSQSPAAVARPQPAAPPPPAPQPPPPPQPPPRPPPPPSAKPPQALSFAKRLQQLIEALKGKAFFDRKHFHIIWAFMSYSVTFPS
uniref:Acrosin n=1 Tax=Phocoena sinus TaxID=42100 RepID=A0A8C9E3Z2_PHOSS